jgi:Flp pilus assembly protein TadG
MKAVGSRRRTSGTAIIEFSLCAPLLIWLVLGIIRFGYGFFVYAELEQAVRSAARYASVRTYGSDNATPNSAYLTAVRNVAVYGNPAGGTEAMAPGLSTENVSVTMAFANGVPSKVMVAISNYTLPQIVGSVRLINKPTVQFPYLGIFAPPV